MAEAFGETLGLGIAGLWSPETALKLAELRLKGEAFDLGLAGTLKGTTFDGDIALQTPSIASFSGLAGRQLGGALDLKAAGTVDALTGSFDLSLDGTARNLALGMDAADAVLAGETRLSGRLARDETGFTADSFVLGNAQTRLTATGGFSSDAADFRFDLTLADLGFCPTAPPVRSAPRAPPKAVRAISPLISTPGCQAANCPIIG